MTKANPSETSIPWHFFGAVPESYQQILAPAFALVALAPDERLIQQGEWGDTLYIVLSGQLRVIDEELDAGENILAFKGPGDGVGEISLLTGERRTASVDAVVASQLVALSKKRLDEVTTAVPQASHLIYQSIHKRVHQSRLNHVLIKANIFKGLEANVWRDIQAELELITIASGETVIEVGQPSDALFVVIGGCLRIVSKVVGSDELYLADVYRGQTVGEIGLITGEKRTAKVFALRDSLLAKLSQAAFKRLLQKYPEAMLARFAGPIIQRLQDQLAGHKPTKGKVTTISVIPCDRSVPLAEFSQKLTQSLSQLGSAIHLNSQRCDELLGTEGGAYLADDDLRNGRFIFWLNEQEASHDYVLYEADYEPTAWTNRCVRQADLLLIVGNADGSPAISAIETALLDRVENQHTVQCLVLLHEDTSKPPQDTMAWLRPRKLRDHYHVRLQETADFGRIGRLLTGQGIGLVLSGGGARALAHIGVMQALVEKGIPIDAICGTSGGSMYGALYAMGLKPEEMLSKTAESLNKFDYTLPLHALMVGASITNSLAHAYGPALIENLWYPYFCVSANLSQASLMIHSDGPLFHAVRASIAIPGILPPVFHEGDILSDGGLINNLPTDLMRDRPDIGYVIAVNVARPNSDEKAKPFDYAISGWKSLWQRLMPWGKKPEFPSIGDVIMRSLTITNTQTGNITKHLADLYLEPPVRMFGMLEFEKDKELAEIGYQYATEQLKEWHNERIANYLER